MGAMVARPWGRGSGRGAPGLGRLGAGWEARVTARCGGRAVLTSQLLEDSTRNFGRLQGGLERLGLVLAASKCLQEFAQWALRGDNP
jgi:hypothetical protein